MCHARNSLAHSIVSTILSLRIGNMALHFDNEGTCLIVRQYLERSRNVLRSELGDKIEQLFSYTTVEPKVLPKAKEPARETEKPSESTNNGHATANANSITV